MDGRDARWTVGRRWGRRRAVERQRGLRRVPEETLRRLEEEQKEFREVLDRLRIAKDRASSTSSCPTARAARRAGGDNGNGNGGSVPQTGSVRSAGVTLPVD